ncbi:MAG: thermonuclease family protein, partial [Shimia sp.]
AVLVAVIVVWRVFPSKRRTRRIAVERLTDSLTVPPGRAPGSKPPPRRDRHTTSPPPTRPPSPIPPDPDGPKARAARARAAAGGTLTGRCRVVDGDTIVIGTTSIRLFGMDALELHHPYGHVSRRAMADLCRGHEITAEIRPEASYDRVVARCFLPDGRDLSAELVALGLAIDGPRFSGGIYRHLEVPDARRKMWRADAKQKGRYDPARHG